jgi:hypothetical protein
MSYASECLARGRTMWNDTLQGVRERHAQRWFLVLPVAFIGSVLSWIVPLFGITVLVPGTWDGDDWWPGDIGMFFFAYTCVILVATVAPSFKRTIAVLAAVGVLGLFYEWVAPDEYQGWSALPLAITLVVSVSIALVLVFLRCPPHWMLIGHAYWIGFLLMLPGLPFFGIISLGSQNALQWGLHILGGVAAFGAVMLPALLAPSHPVRVALGFFLVNLTFGMESIFEWHKFKDSSYLTLPELFLGSLTALAFVYCRTNRGAIAESHVRMKRA